MGTKLLEPENNIDNEKEIAQKKQEHAPTVNPFIDKLKEPKTVVILIKLFIAVIAVTLAVCFAKPFIEKTIAESYATKAVSKGRVLLRGAQVVARDQMVGGMSMDDTELYLTKEEYLDEIVTTAKFEVYPEEIISTEINERGEIVFFVCTLIYEDKRYEITLDIEKDSSISILDENYQPPEEKK